MAEKNVMISLLVKIVGVLVGILFTVFCVYAVPTMAGHIITNDKEARARDSDITKCYQAADERLEDKFDRIMAGIGTIKTKVAIISTAQVSIKENIQRLEN